MARAQRECQQQQRAQHLYRVTQREDLAAVEMIGGVPGDQHQGNKRQELREPDESEVEWIVPDRIHLPADGHRLHLHRKGRHESCGEKPSESRMAQSGKSPRRLWHCCG